EAAVPDFDPASAGKLLDDAGWIDHDKDGIRDRAGKQLHLVLIAGERPKPAEASGPKVMIERDYLVDAARRAGVIVEVKTGNAEWLAKRLADGHYDLAELSWGGMADGDVTALVGGRDPARPAQPRVDRALDAIAAAYDPAAREKLA